MKMLVEELRGLRKLGGWQQDKKVAFRGSIGVSAALASKLINATSEMPATLRAADELEETIGDHDGLPLNPVARTLWPRRIIERLTVEEITIGETRDVPGQIDEGVIRVLAQLQSLTTHGLCPKLNG